MREIFNDVLSKTQEIENPKTEHLFSEWKRNKQHIIDLFGGELRITLPEPVSVDLTADYMENCYTTFIGKYILHADHPSAFSSFFYNQGAEAFYENKVKYGLNINHPKINIPVGMKLSRALKSFFSSEAKLHQCQSEYSRIIQEKKITGYITLSVHPLDYLTISQNKHNWRSCMALDGEYRSGVLGYMMDKNTIVAYLSSGEDDVELLEGFTWNSKRWRMLVFLNENHDIAVFSKPYPSAIDSCRNTVRDMLAELCEWMDVEQEEYTSRTLFDAGILQDNKYFTGYNDVTTSYRYSDNVCVVHDWLPQDPPKMMTIGTAATCICCGEDYITIGDCMLCPDCGGYSKCDICGCGMYDEDSRYLEGDYVCETCFDDNAEYCDYCDEVVDMRHERMFETPCGDYVCEYCYNNTYSDDEDDE